MINMFDRQQDDSIIIGGAILTVERTYGGICYVRIDGLKDRPEWRVGIGNHTVVSMYAGLVQIGCPRVIGMTARIEIWSPDNMLVMAWEAWDRAQRKRFE